jgi:hypothetical protein
MRSAAQLESIFPPPKLMPPMPAWPATLIPLKQFAVLNTGGATAVFAGISGAATFVTLLPMLLADPPALWLLFTEELLCV